MRKPSLTDAERILHGISEDELQENVMRLCKLLGLPAYHTHDSRRSPEGWPDLAIVRGGALILRELKAMTGKLTPAQIRWLEALSHVTRVESGVWTPRDWVSGKIEYALRSGDGVEPAVRGGA